MFSVVTNLGSILMLPTGIIKSFEEGVKTIQMNFSKMILEGFCYVGIALSCLIARNIYRMEEKSFLSKMFLVYFTVDFVVGLVEKYFHFVVVNGRYIYDIL